MPSLRQTIANELRDQADGQPLQRTHVTLGGAAKFHCRECNKDWSSKHACLELFLTRPGGLAHFKLYKQSCVTCSNEASPNFTERVVRDFVTRALFKARGLRHTGPPVVFRNKKPHARALCEACQTDPNQRFH